MRLKIGALIAAILVGFVLTAPRSSAFPPEIVLPRLTPTPSPSPTPVPTPTPKPKPKPPAKPSDDKRKPLNSGHGRRVIYSNPKQRVWIVDAQGNVVGTWLVSGKRSIPSAGEYHVFSRSRYATSEHGLHMEYMVRFAHGERLAIGLHSIPKDDAGRPAQSESELGSYRSAGCVRQKYSDAQKMWDFAQLDTKVVVIY
jgi:lipoprotein-anchoring transpeptidase ErfK/SrfK